MKIDQHTNLHDLAERMGTEATIVDARVMLEFLLVGDWERTEDVPEGVWHDCLEMVGEASKAV